LISNAAEKEPSPIGASEGLGGDASVESRRSETALKSLPLQWNLQANQQAARKFLFICKVNFRADAEHRWEHDYYWRKGVWIGGF
jgi:hypothetical protein